MTGSMTGAFAAFLYFLWFQLCGYTLSNHILRRETLAVRLLFGSVFGLVMLEWFPILAACFVDFTLIGHAAAMLMGLLAASYSGIKLNRVSLGRKRRDTPDGEAPLRPKLQSPGSLTDHPDDSPTALYRRSSGALPYSPTLDDKAKPLTVFFQQGGFILLPLLFFCFLVLHGFRIEDGAVYASQATYGDMAMHLGFITSIAKQGTFPPEYSILYGTRLSYPFLSDSISSSLYLLGAPLRFAYCMPAFFAAAQAMLGLYLFALRWLKDTVKAIAAWVLYFFNGGLGFIYAMEPGGLYALLHNFYETPTNDITNNIRWVNVLVDMMLPQRATLFGWAVLFPAMYLLYRAVFEGKRKYYIYCGVLFGALPMIHTHSLLFAAILCLIWMLISLLRVKNTAVWLCVGKWLLFSSITAFGILATAAVRGGWKLSDTALYVGLGGIFLILTTALWVIVRHIRAVGLKSLFFSWGLLLLIVCVLALPQLFYWTFSQAQGDGFLRGCFNWANNEDSYFCFYLKNLGVVAVLLPFALAAAAKRDFVRFLPAAACWFVAESICFQPNEYDNNKLLYPAYALICCLCAGFMVDLLRRIRKRPLRVTVGIAVMGICMVSAILTIARESIASYILYDTNAVRLAQYIEETLEPDAVILTGDRHNNEIAGLTGRNIVCGSGTFLYFHGLDYQNTAEAVAQMYRDPATGLFERYQVDYILISNDERIAYEMDEELFASLFECIYNKDDVQLYKVIE